MSKHQEVTYNITQGIEWDGRAVYDGGTVCLGSMAAGVLGMGLANSFAGEAVNAVTHIAAPYIVAGMVGGAASLGSGIIATIMNDFIDEEVISRVKNGNSLLSTRDQKKYRNIGTGLLLSFSMVCGGAASWAAKPWITPQQVNNNTVQSEDLVALIPSAAP